MAEKELHAKFEEIRREMMRLGVESPPMPETFSVRDRLLLAMIEKSPQFDSTTQTLAAVVPAWWNLYVATTEFRDLEIEQQNSLSMFIADLIKSVTKALKDESRRRRSTRPVRNSG